MPNFGEYLKKALDTEVKPGDENTPANSLGNYIIDKTGMPKEWMQNTADYKKATAELPQAMGMGSMGTIGKVTGAAEQALAKLVNAQQAGQKLSTIEQMLLNKATGKVNPMKTAEEMNVPEAFQKLRGWMGK